MNFLTFRTLFIIACVLTNFSQHAHAYRDLETGTFITRDPAGHIDGPNEYTYVRQNPWTKFDPLGLYEVNGEAWDPNAEKWTTTKDKEGRHVTKLIDGGDEVRTDMAVTAFNAKQSGDWTAVYARMDYAAARGDGSVITQYREAVAGANPQYNAQLNSWGDTMGMLSPADMVNPNRMGISPNGSPSRAQLLKTKGGLPDSANNIQSKNKKIINQQGFGSTYTPADFPKVESKLSQKQLRHIANNKAYRGGGYLNSVDDAQQVLNAYKSGDASILGKTKQGFPVVSYEGVSGVNVNIAAGYRSQPTNVFMIKGTKSPSVVPMNPNWEP